MEFDSDGKEFELQARIINFLIGVSIFGEWLRVSIDCTKVIFSHGEVRTSFEKCRRDNLNAIWATERLYIEGIRGSSS